MCRYFDFDEIEGKKPASPGTSGIEEKREIGMYPEAIYTYLFFFSRSTDADISEKALTALGHLCSAYPDFFERRELRNMYQGLLASTEEKHLPLKVEVLKNLSLFLTVEEERMVKAREECKFTPLISGYI